MLRSVLRPFAVNALGIQAVFAADVPIEELYACWQLTATLRASFENRGIIRGSHGLTPVAHGPGVTARGVIHSTYYSTNILCAGAQPPSCGTISSKVA